MPVIICGRMTCLLNAWSDVALRHSNLIMTSVSVFCFLVEDILGGVSSSQRFSESDTVVKEGKWIKVSILKIVLLFKNWFCDVRRFCWLF
jgi:hypothetical protein